MERLDIEEPRQKRRKVRRDEDGADIVGTNIESREEC